MSAVLELPEKVKKATVNANRNDGIKPFRITVEIYDLMIKHGILTENDNVELLNGEIIEKMPKGTKHTSVTRFITKYFYRRLPDEIVIQVQDPIVLDDSSEPEPDIVLANPDKNNYTDRKPNPQDILLLIEVSDSTLNLDRNVKKKLYAEAGIVQYLIVNVEDETIEDYRQPAGDEYLSKQTYRIGDRFALVAFPEIEINVADFLQKPER